MTIVLAADLGGTSVKAALVTSEGISSRRPLFRHPNPA
jgi:sugar (pentulose or hexulose) kinase